MTISGVTESEYISFLKHGGDLTFYGVRATDIDSSASFEGVESIRSKLDSGFELRPSLIIHDDGSRAPLLLYGGSWTRVIVSAYANGGTIVYRRMADNLYEAAVRVPIRK